MPKSYEYKKFRYNNILLYICNIMISFKFGISSLFNINYSYNINIHVIYWNNQIKKRKIDDEYKLHIATSNE